MTQGASGAGCPRVRNVRPLNTAQAGIRSGPHKLHVVVRLPREACKVPAFMHICMRPTTVLRQYFRRRSRIGHNLNIGLGRQHLLKILLHVFLSRDESQLNLSCDMCNWSHLLIIVRTHYYPIRHTS
jgi:hypothetical protein